MKKMIKRAGKSNKSTSLIEKILSFFSKTNKPSKGNNFDLWNDKPPLTTKSKSEIKKNK